MNRMEERDKLVEQPIAVEAQGEASAPQSVENLTVLVPPIQITAQMAQQMGTFFQQMANHLSAQAQAQTQLPQELHEKGKNGEWTGQSSNSNWGKRKNTREPNGYGSDRGGSSGWKELRTYQQRNQSSYLTWGYVS